MALHSESSNSAEQAELNSLISQHLALKNALDFPELDVADTQPTGVLWPPKVFSLSLDTYNSRRPSLVTLAPYPFQLPTLRKNDVKKMTEKRAQFHIINGCKLHRLPRKEAPYPLSYDRAVLDSDIVDRISLKKLYKNGLTLHDFGDKPPSFVLDIGTGSGSWVIEAAGHWQKAISLIGYDLVDIQPHLSPDGPLSDLRDRVKWVHGNALEAFPFSDDHFDFVRICRIALGVPENKWNHVLEEAVRVLKPGGVLEILEEDIIFPFRAPEDKVIPKESLDFNHDRSAATSISIHGEKEGSGPSAPPSTAGHSTTHSVQSHPTHFYSQSGSTTSTSSRRPLSIVVPKTLNPRTRSRSLGSHNNSSTPNFTVTRPSATASVPSSYTSHTRTYTHANSHTHTSGSQFRTHKGPISGTAFIEAEKTGKPLRDPRDHSILSQAWNSMLDDRFISSKPTSLLNFYLSLHVQNIRSHEPIQIIAPPPSNGLNRPYTYRDTETNNNVMNKYDISLAPLDAAPSTKSRNSSVMVTGDAPMHLRRCLQVVLGCSEALWEQVHKAHPNMQREAFDFLLKDFELDMLDRIDTRSALKSGIGWDICVGTDSGDIRAWRERLTKFPKQDDEVPLICRNIRGFVGIKG